MPFTEDTGLPTRSSKEIAHGWKRPAQHCATAADVHRPVAKRIHSGQQLSACWSTHRRDVEIREPHALIMEPVQVRRLQHRIAMAR